MPVMNGYDATKAIRDDRIFKNYKKINLLQNLQIGWCFLFLKT
jgi:hypothetical protein